MQSEVFLLKTLILFPEFFLTMDTCIWNFPPRIQKKIVYIYLPQVSDSGLS